MLVIISDLHLADGTCGHSISSSAFQLFVDRLRELVVHASHRRDGRYRPIQEVDILLMGDSFAEGTANQPFVLPARGEAEFDMTVTTNFVSSLGRLVSRMQGGKLEDVQYQITGKLLLEKGVMRTIPFSHVGTVDFKKARDKLKSAEPTS